MRRPTRASGAAGFTLVELLVTMVLVTIVLGAAVVLFNNMNELSRAQLHQVELQQAVRVVQREMTRLVQMAGRGGLAGWSLVDAGNAAATPAISVRTNVGAAPFADRHIAVGDNGSPLAVAGTDVLTLRGIFSTPVFHIDWTNPLSFTFSGDATGGTGALVVASRTPTGIPQDLRPFNDAAADGIAEALLLVNAVNELTYAVVEFDPGAFATTCDFANWNIDQLCEVTLPFTTTGTNGAAFATLSANGALPDLSSQAFKPGFAGIVEEYRYYVREDVTPDALGIVSHTFSRARFFPGTEAEYDADPANANANLREDVADSIFDFQVALGYDSSFHCGGAANGHFAADAEVPPELPSGCDDRIFDAIAEATGSADADDWLFNDVDDIGTLDTVPWSADFNANPTEGWPADRPQPVLYYARVTVGGRTPRPDRGFQAPVLDAIEDHVYAPDDPMNTEQARLHRREILTSVIDLRNIG